MKTDHAPSVATEPATIPDHLSPRHWARANRQLLAKAIGEFAHERLLEPRLSDAGSDLLQAELACPDRRHHYRFKLRRHALNHWQIEAGSIHYHGEHGAAEPDLLAFVLAFQQVLQIPDPVLPVYLEELSSTLAAICYQLEYPALPAAQLALADFQTIETAMSEGHPGFVANHGRVGFAVDDYPRYAPEAAQAFCVLWLAAHRDHSQFTAIDGLDEACLLSRELATPERERLLQTLIRRGLEPADYLLLPVHPWQWHDKLATVFASDLACQRLVLLGRGDSTYLAQQSIRTLFNRSHPQRCYVKTALSILNMGFMRGLSAEYMASTPAINQWLAELIAVDPVLQQMRFGILREVAAIGYRQPYYQQCGDRHSPYRKMLAALWRESPIPRLQPQQRLMTMAALLHLDTGNDSLLAALIRASSLSPAAWLTYYLDAYLSPLLHCLFAYGLVFMPHGENVILILEQHVPRQVLLKDIGEEIAILRPGIDLPTGVERIALELPIELHALSVFTDIFDGYLRFLAVIMQTHLGLAGDRFWAAVAATVHRYQQQHPEFAVHYASCDLFAAEFEHSCLNRLQLRNNQQMLDLANPAGSLQMAGQLVNPIARFRDPASLHGLV